MGAGCNQERRIHHRYRIEVNAQGRHPGQRAERWLDMDQALLACPWTEAVNIDASHHRYCSILMPTELPIRRGGFVEQDRPDRTAIVPENARGDGADPTGIQEDRLQQRNAMESDSRLIRSEARDGLLNAPQVGAIDCRTESLRPAVCERQSIWFHERRVEHAACYLMS
jgi:hypothetical protein